NLEGHMPEKVELLKRYCMENKLPMEARIVIRPIKESYYYISLGKGYFLIQINGTGRCCTSCVKILPQYSARKEINPSYIIMGVRLRESAKRKNSIRKWTIDEKLNQKIGEHVDLKDTRTFMPIVDFTIEDVWEYLQKIGTPWSSTRKVRD